MFAFPCDGQITLPRLLNYTVILQGFRMTTGSHSGSIHCEMDRCGFSSRSFLELYVGYLDFTNLGGFLHEFSLHHPSHSAETAFIIYDTKINRTKSIRQIRESKLNKAWPGWNSLSSEWFDVGASRRDVLSVSHSTSIRRNPSDH